MFRRRSFNGADQRARTAAPPGGRAPRSERFSDLLFSRWTVVPAMAGVAVSAWYAVPLAPERDGQNDGLEQTASRVAPGSQDRLEPGSELRSATASRSITAKKIEIDGREVEVVADALLVRPADPAQARATLASLGSRVIYESSSGYWRVSLPAGAQLEPFLTTLQGSSSFAAVQPEGILRATSIADGVIAQRGLQWNLDQIHWDEAMDSGLVSLEELSQITVAVVDSGVAYEDYSDGQHTYVRSTDLDHSVFVPGADFIDNDGHPNDVSGHGTHIANIIGADGGAAGVAPHVGIMPVRVLDHANVGTELALIDGLHYAIDHGADLINLSLSFGYGYVPGLALAEAIQAAEDNEVVVLASSGNMGVDQVSYPAAYGTVIAVGASRLTAGRQSWVADYSNTGSGLDLVAPGGVANLDVDGNGKSDGVVAQSIEPGNPAALHYYLMAGTSQAAAHATGAAAWLRAMGASNEQIRHLLVSTSRAVWGKRAFWTRQGMGVLDLNAALEAYVDGGAEVDKPFYVNVLPLMYGDGGNVGALGLIKVIDASGKPARKVLVAGHWFGSSPSNFGVITNNRGEAWVATGTTVSGSSPAAFGLQVDRVIAGTNKVTSSPRSFYYLSQGMLKSMLQWYEDPRMDGANLVFTVEPDLFGMPSWVASSYVAKPFGALNAFAPTAVACNSAYLSGLSSLPESAFTPITASFPTPQGFGWGTTNSHTVRVADDVPMADGELLRMGVAPLDLSAFYAHLAPSFPLLNASSQSMDTANADFLGGLHDNAEGADEVTVIPAGSTFTLASGQVLTLTDGTLFRLADGSFFSLSPDVRLTCPAGVALTLAGDATATLAQGISFTLAGDALATLSDGTQRLLPAGTELTLSSGIAFTLGEGIAFTLGEGIAFTLGEGIAFTLGEGIAFTLGEGVAFTLSDGIAFTLGDGIAFTLGEGVAFTLSDGIAFTLGEGIAFTLGEGIAFTLGEGIAFTLGEGIMLTKPDGIAFSIADGAFQSIGTGQMAESVRADGGEDLLYSVALAEASLQLGEDGSLADPSASSLSTLGASSLEMIELSGSAAAVPEMVASSYQESPTEMPSPIDVPFQGAESDFIFETPDLE